MDGGVGLYTQNVLRLEHLTVTSAWIGEWYFACLCVKAYPILRECHYLYWHTMSFTINYCTKLEIWRESNYIREQAHLTSRGCHFEASFYLLWSLVPLPFCHLHMSFGSGRTNIMMTFPWSPPFLALTRPFDSSQKLKLKVFGETSTSVPVLLWIYLLYFRFYKEKCCRH